jgi:small-conductance mechanosensitive channel
MQPTETEATAAPAGGSASESREPTEAQDAGATPVESSVDEAPVSSELLDTVLWDLMPEAVQTPLEFLASYPLLLLPIAVGMGYLLGKVLQGVLTGVGHRLTKRTKGDYDDRLLAIARKPVLTVPVILSLMLVTAIVPMPGLARTITVNVLATLVLLSLTRAALKCCHVILELLADSQDKVDIVEARTLPMFDITAKVVIVAVTGYLALLIWGIDPTAWLASAGVIGIAVGFAARDTLANLFSGIFIVVDSPYKIGDYVVLDTGERGEVTHVGLRSTRLLTRDDVEVTIPNAIIANAKIINESGGPWEKYRIRIPVGVAYGSDVDQVSDVLEEEASRHPDILDYPAPRVRMRAFGASSLDFELLGWVDKPVHRGRVTDSLMKAIYKRFQAEDITIPFPQTDVHLRHVGPEGD